MAKPMAFRISMKPLASGGDCSATAPRFGLFFGGLFRSVKALLPRQWHVESGP